MPSLTFPMQQQLLTNWCWAAVASSATVFFGDNPAQRQCDVASLLLRTLCCPGNAPCDVQQNLEHALAAVNHFLGPVLGPANSMAAVAAEITQGHPIGVRIQFHGTIAGHFVVIDGFETNEERLHVHDPRFGRSFPLFSELRANYLGRGFWTHSYLIAGKSRPTT